MNFFTILFAALAVEVAPVDFDTEIVPLLTKAGCNTAACHGSATGRGGLKLSLFGGDPAWDFTEIVHRLEGRRVNLVSPGKSLILAKPTEQIAHEGGTRFDDDSQQAATLSRWIEQGALRTQLRMLIGLEITPRNSLASLTDKIQLRVRAKFDDGTIRDVTDAAVYTSSDDAALEANESGALSILRRGRHHVIVRFLTDVQAVHVTVPVGQQLVDLSDSPRNNWIDDEVIKTLTELRLVPSPQANDATLFRRVSLHLTGRLPQSDAVASYLSNDDPEKFSKLIDRMLDSPEFLEYWTFRLSRLLRINPQQNNLPATRAFHDWVKAQLREGTGWDRMATALLVAEGDTHEVGPANFYLVAGDARSQAEYASELLMGVRLGCANCHNHPLDAWTQDDYHGLAAIFARIERGRHVRATDNGQVIHPVTGEAAVPRIPGDRFIEEQVDLRQELAKWLTAESNAYFSRAMVNRIWKALMGRGLVEPTDDLRATNPASHPELLARLESEFVANSYSLRNALKTIVTSAAYARSSQGMADNEGDRLFYSHALVTNLEPEVLADAIADVTGIAEPYGDQPVGTRAIALFTPPESEALEVLGRCDRAGSCETTESSSGGLTTKLHLLNGDLLNRRLLDKTSRLSQLLESGKSVSETIEYFYLAALSRPPRRDELEFWSKALESGESPTLRQNLEDFVWALLNSHEFLTNH